MISDLTNKEILDISEIFLKLDKKSWNDLTLSAFIEQIYELLKILDELDYTSDDPRIDFYQKLGISDKNRHSSIIFLSIQLLLRDLESMDLVKYANEHYYGNPNKYYYGILKKIASDSEGFKKIEYIINKVKGV